MAHPDALAIVGGGIAGLATALALGQQHQPIALYERADTFTEAGAGIGLGPNAMRVCQSWGLSKALLEMGCVPEQLLACDATNAQVCGRLHMGQSFIEKYGAPYVTVHRADLHQVLMHAVLQLPAVELHLNHTLTAVGDQRSERLSLEFNHGQTRLEVPALIGADGLQSKVRQCLFDSTAPVPTGHWAYRSLLPASDVPLALRGSQVTIWMGPHLHVVHYPVRGGEYVNVVVLLASVARQAQPGWDVQTSSAQIALDLQLAMRGCCVPLQELIHAVTDWRAWCLFDRPTLQQASQMAQGQVALVGDAAHPMLPYLAQGAGMAVEDAACLAMHWCQQGLSVQTRLMNYAQARWQRAAKVQQRARRNGVIFHAKGPLRWARNAALGLAGDRLMDMPWLYAA